MGERYPHDSGYSVQAYFDLVKQGVLAENDRVELLDGLIVAEPPPNPPHVTAVEVTATILRGRIGARALVREEKPLILGDRSVPEPDVMVVPGSWRDYATRHPETALLIVEVSDSSLPHDRLSKSRIYAGAGIPEYWILNLPGDCLETYREPDAARRLYARRRTWQRGERLSLVAFPDVTIAVDELLPWPPRPHDD